MPGATTEERKLTLVVPASTINPAPLFRELNPGIHSSRTTGTSITILSTVMLSL